MSTLTYHFGTGDGPVHRHRSPADLDLPGGAAAAGVPDAVRLDFDGDDRVDDAMWDSDGDGVVDRAVLDLDDDGRPERAFADPSGRGVWDTRATPPAAASTEQALPADPTGGDPPSGPPEEVTWTDVRGREHTATVTLDTDGDGVLDGAVVEADGDRGGREVVCDLDGDGVAEQLFVDHGAGTRAPGGPGSVWSAYTASEPGSGRWDVLLADVDADGVADTVVTEGVPGWLPP